MAVMFNNPARGQGRRSVAEGLSPGMGAEPPSREQGAFTGQADPEPPELVLLPWPWAPGVSNSKQPSLV